MIIYVGNLAEQTTEKELRGAFAPYGYVSQVSIMTDKRSDLPRGFGFVEMDRAEEAKYAITQLHGTLLGDRTLQVNEAGPRAKRTEKKRSRVGHP